MKNISNVFVRTIAVWTPSFITNLIAEKRSGPTWLFWFFWNILISAALAGLLIWGVNSFSDIFFNKAWPTFNEKIDDFELEIKDGELITSFKEPITLIDGDIAFVLDTQQKEYTPAVLDDFKQGVFITKNKIIHKENFRTQEVSFSEFEGFKLTKHDLEIFAKESYPDVKNIVLTSLVIILFLFLCIFRLLTALIWALIFWVVGIMWGVKKWNFGTAYLAVLNLYFVALILSVPMMFLGIPPFLASTFIIFMIFFNINFYNAPREISDEN